MKIVHHSFTLRSSSIKTFIKTYPVPLRMPCYEQTNKKKGLKSETTFFCIFSHNKEALKIRDKMIKSLLHMPTRYQSFSRT